MMHLVHVGNTNLRPYPAFSVIALTVDAGKLK